MAYQFLEIAEAADEIREFIIRFEADLPEHLKARLLALTKTGVSPVDLVTGFVRAVWTNRTTLPAKPKRLAIAAAELAQAKGYHEQIEQRAAQIANALHRDLNDDPPSGISWPAKADDPDVDSFYVAPPPEPALEPSPAPAEALTTPESGQ